MTVVAIAASVDAKAGSIRYVTTVIAASALADTVAGFVRIRMRWGCASKVLRLRLQGFVRLVGIGPVLVRSVLTNLFFAGYNLRLGLCRSTGQHSVPVMARRFISRPCTQQRISC